MLKNNSYKPSTFLSKYIDRFYVLEQSSNDFFDLPEVLPGTGLELVFHRGKPLSVNQETLPKAHTVCPRKMFRFDKERKVSFISVRFKSGAFRHFSPIPFSELNNNYFSLKSLWQSNGEQLLDELESISETIDKIEVIERFLLEAFNRFHNEDNDKWDLIIDELYYNFNGLSIREFAKESNLSLRQFERGFKSQFGLTAKEFQKIARFQDVVKKMLLRKESDYLDTILENGYFDQSHFIKEFKFLTQKTPLEYLNEKNFASHFYHVSIKKDDR